LFDLAKELAGIGGTDFDVTTLPSAKIVSKARELLPLPLTPVKHPKACWREW